MTQNRKSIFEEKLKNLYGEAYDTSNTKYVNARTPIKLICLSHGEFEQKPHALLSGHGCPYCSGYKLNTTMFLEKLYDVFGDKYETTKVNYVNSHTKVELICHEKDVLGNEHGSFTATPSNLLHGFGCPKCGKVYQYTTEEFINLANYVHENEYDYAKTNYINTKSKIEVICHNTFQDGTEHGSFFTTPNKHLSGCGCPKCAKLHMGKERKTFSEYVEEAKNIHGNKYDYLEFEKYSSLAKMYCHVKDDNGNEHGEFWQLPANHLKGRGCPKCRSSHLEEKVRLFLEHNNVKYMKEQTFEWLKKHNYLPLDFFLPDYNVAIECQGKQHYEPVNFGGKMTEERQQENLRIQLINDQFKKEECEKHGVEIIYVTYKDKNIDDIISSKLNLST